MTRAFAETSTRTPSIRAMLVLLVGVWLALQGWLLTAHWINADEGAHLMDARLVLEGLIPEVDFHARQPLYVYAYVPFLRLFGVGYVAGRLMPVLATLLSAGVLFLIGRRLWGRMEGWCAAILYLWAPTILIDTAVVKTEPLAILLTALGLLGVVASIQRRHWWFLFAAGVAFGAGYYVRESTLAGLVVSGLILLAQAREGLGVLAKRLAVLGFGFGAVCLGVIACYARSLPLAQLLSHEGLFPFYRILVSVARILGWWSPSPASGMGEVVRWSSQTWFDTTRNLEDALSLNLPFLAGVIAAGWYGVSALVRRQSSQAVSADQEL
ncbi:MAG: glycosyltransferase family 39 protein, partial [Candidatus Omnitrophica bacterium]|nr:glycosyltransferase family 39 protein [Candidatus Omnitrophota bacterium]